MTESELYHHGIQGMKWGVRRYQNKDGSLTPAGRKHYNKLYDKYEGQKAYAESLSSGIHSGKYREKSQRMAESARAIREADKTHKKLGKDLYESIKAQRLKDIDQKRLNQTIDIAKKYMESTGRSVQVVKLNDGSIIIQAADPKNRKLNLPVDKVLWEEK